MTADTSHANALPLACLAHSPASDAEWAGLSEDAWQAVIGPAARLGVAPLLYHRRHTLGLDGLLPAPLMQQAGDLYHRNVHRLLAQPCTANTSPPHLNS